MLTVSEAVETRRSVRAYLRRPVDDVVLLNVLDRARWSPSGGNIQPWEILLLRSDGVQKFLDGVAESVADAWQ